ncbi:MAG TPA: hypothetical protein VIN75_17520 [Burkholderiaceae bacterium]
MPALRLLALAAATLACSAAVATTLSTGKPAGPQAGTSGLATRDQLRDCMMTEAGLKQRFEALQATSAAHEKMAAQVEAESDHLAELQAKLDHDSSTAIKAFNSAVDEHNRHVAELNKDARDSDPASHAYNEDMAAFNHRCAKLRYSVDDMDAVMTERKKAAAAAAAASR